MGRGLVVLEKEKIKQFEKLLHIAKGNNTLNMFLEKCNISPLYIEWTISGKSFVVPHDSLLKRLSESSCNRVSFKKFKEIFKGYNQPKIKAGQVWYVKLKDDKKEEMPYYIVDVNVGGEYSGYVKLAPIVDYREEFRGNNIKLTYETLDGILIKNMVLLDEYIVMERKCLLSFIASLYEELENKGSINETYDENIKSIASYIKKLFT